MKPLVYYCRWHDASLRLRGRSETAVWGDLVFANSETEKTQPFRFDLNTRELTLKTAAGTELIQLDEKGVTKNKS